MAESFGVAAGVVGLAGLTVQVINSVAELREAYLGLKNVPRDLESLLEEISLFSIVLKDLAEEELQQDERWKSLCRVPSTLTLVERQQTSNYQSAVTKNTECCRQAIAHLGNVLTDIHDAYEKRGSHKMLASFKFVIHKKQIMRGFQRLERVKSLLSISHQCLLQ